MILTDVRIDSFLLSLVFFIFHFAADFEKMGLLPIVKYKCIEIINNYGKFHYKTFYT